MNDPRRRQIMTAAALAGAGAAVVLAFAVSRGDRDPGPSHVASEPVATAVDSAPETPPSAKPADGEPPSTTSPATTERLPEEVAPLAPSSPSAGKGKTTAPASRSRAGDTAAAVKQRQIAIADKMVEAANKFAADLAAAKGDCKRATEVVKSGGRAMKKAMADTDKLQAELNNDQQARTWFQQNYGPKIMTALQEIGAVVNQCREDKEFEAAFKLVGIGSLSGESPPRPSGAAPAAAPGPSAAAAELPK
jgi:hypothetical protein